MSALASSYAGCGRARSAGSADLRHDSASPPGQAETLQLIGEKGALSTSVLASLLGIDPSTASRNLAGLERAGLISRKRAPDDGRQTDVRLTPRGRRTADTVTANAFDALTDVIDKVPRAERQRVTDALEILARVVGEVRP